jgi:F-type H+-transporting ATPase subunit delta
MATTTDAKAIAGALFESLVGGAAEQLKAAAPRLAQLSNGKGDLGTEIAALLPADTMPQVRNFVLGLAKEGLLDQVGAIAEAFAGFAARETAPLDAEITSAVALEPSQQAKIEADLKQRYGVELSVQYKVDPSLIGGLIIRVGDQVLDNSLRARLGALQRNMLAS